MTLQGKTVVVTGAAGTMGLAVVRMMLEDGAQVALVDIDAMRLDGLIRFVRGTTVAVPCDISDPGAVKQAHQQVEKALGPVDILVNNAGWDVAKPFLQTEPDLWDKIIAINLRGPLNLHKAALPHLIAAGGGKVVNIASDAGRVGSSGEAPYSACKGGIIALTKTLARELASKNIQLNVVCPGLTETGMLEQFMQGAGNPEKLREAYRRAVPIGRLGKPDDIAGAVLFLASDDAEFITGQTISVSGGLTMHG